MEFLVALLFVSGPLRGVAEFLTLPLFNPAVFSLTLILSVFLYKVVFKGEYWLSKEGLVFASTFFSLLGAVAISSIYTPSTEVFLYKTAISILPISSVLVFCFIKEFNIERFSIWVVRLSVPVCLLFLYFFPQWRLGLLDEKYYNLDIIRTLYLGVGGLSAFSLLLLLVYPLKIGFFAATVLQFIFLLTLLISSARAPLVFLLICLMLASLAHFVRACLSGRATKWLALFPIAGVIVIPLLFIFISSLEGDALTVIKMSMDRLLLLTSSDKGASVNTRIIYFKEAMKYIDLSPIVGSGVASFGRLVLKEEIFMHPHNIFIESWFELGLFGVTLMALIFIFSIWFSVKSRAYAILFCLIFLWLNALKSFSYAENRQLFILIGVAFYAYQHRKFELMT